MTPVVFFAAYWWLLFPIGGFLFAGFGMWMQHRHQQRTLEIIKSYADQGKDVPPEVMKAVGGGPDAYGAPPGYGPGAYGPGPYGPWGGGWGGWRAYRWGPYWAWRRVFIFGALAAGFGFASQYGGWDGEGASGLFVVAIIMGFLFIGSVLTAIMSTAWRPK